MLFPAPRSNAPIRTYTSTTNRCIFDVQLHFIHFFSLRQSQNKFRFAHSAKRKRCKKQLMKFFHEIAVSASSACRSAMSTVRRVQSNASLGRRVAYTAIRRNRGFLFIFIIIGILLPRSQSRERDCRSSISYLPIPFWRHVMGLLIAIQRFWNVCFQLLSTRDVCNALNNKSLFHVEQAFIVDR